MEEECILISILLSGWLSLTLRVQLFVDCCILLLTEKLYNMQEICLHNGFLKVTESIHCYLYKHKCRTAHPEYVDSRFYFKIFFILLYSGESREKLFSLYKKIFKSWHLYACQICFNIVYKRCLGTLCKLTQKRRCRIIYQ